MHKGNVCRRTPKKCSREQAKEKAAIIRGLFDID
jgi:hypothetical protein